MTVEINVSDNIARITLSSPGTLNRVDHELAFNLGERTTEARQRDDVWVVVLDSEGPDFCAGTAQEALDSVTDGVFPIEVLKAGGAIADIEKPVICALTGAAHEQGLEIALACDIRIADPTTTFRMNHAASGLLPWDGGTQRLPRLVGRSRATDMLLTGRQLEVAEAFSYGLVNEVVEGGTSKERALSLADTIAGHGPIAVRYLKEAVTSGLDVPLAHGLRLEADLSFLLQSTDDRGEGIASFLDRRSPSYRSR